MFASLSRTLLVVNSTFEARTSREAEVLVLRVWRLDTAHHSFTFANAVHQAIQRAPSAELVRGAFDATMSVYLNRFLNVPGAKILGANGAARPDPRELLESLPGLLDRQQQVDQAGALVAGYLACGGARARVAT